MHEHIKNFKFFKIFENPKNIAMPFVMQIGFFITGYLLSSTNVIGGISPLGLSFALAMPNGYALSSGLGAILGYATSIEFLVSLKYLSAVCVASVLRWAFQLNKNSRVISAIGSILTLFAVQFMFYTIFPSNINFAQGISEVMLCVGLTYIFASLPFGFKKLDRLGIKNIAAIFALATSMLCSLLTLSISVINIGFLLCAVVMLTASYCNKERGATIVCTVCIAATVITIPSMLSFATSLTLSALITSLMAKGERVTFALTFLVASFFGAVLAPSPSAVAAYLATCIFGCVIFLVIPLKFLHFSQGSVMHDTRESSVHTSTRLKSLSSALQDIGTVVEDIFKILPKRKDDPTSPIEYACDNICKTCSDCHKCWVSGFQQTMDIMNNALTTLKNTGNITSNDFPPHFTCLKLPEVCGAINRGFVIDISNKTAVAQSQMLKTVLVEQYSAMASALTHVANEIWYEEKINVGKTSLVKKYFCEMELEPLDVAVYEDKNKALRVQVKTERVHVTEAELDAITREVSHCCNKNFSSCTPTHTAGVTSFMFLEKAMLSPKFSKNISPAGDVSADIIDCFCDDHGNAHLILCDGMGTGKMASIDGKMASVLSHRLLAAGFSSECAARLVNVALCLKSEDETGATLDIFSVNLFTGKAILYKAGAVSSFIIRNGKVRIFSTDSLPIGASNTVIGGYEEFDMVANDIVILISDGVLSEGEEWVQKQLEGLTENSTQEIADILVQRAKYISKKQDDISVAVVTLV